jgi:hypothetical protein
MNKRLTLLLCFFNFIFFADAQTLTNCITLKGSINNSFYKQVTIATNNASSDSTQSEIPASAWTCNSTGSPTCNTRALIKYDVSSIPANATITSAKLYLYAKTDNLNGLPGNPTFGPANSTLLQRIINAWQQAGMSWATQPSATTVNQKVLPQSTSTSQNYIVDVTDFVQYWLNKPDSNFGMLCRLENEVYYNSMIFNSGKAPENLQPKIEICYSLPAVEEVGCNTCISIKGNRTNNQFKQVTIATNNPSSDSTQTEIPASAWTCNATGSPTCDTRALIRYDVSSLPANAIINSARLHLYAKTNSTNGQTGNPTFGSANTSLLQRITTAWQQAGMSWSTQPSTTTVNQKVLPQSTNTSQNYVVDLTDFVRYWVNRPDSNFGMLFRLQNEVYYNSMIFNSGQAPEDLQPTLDICYSLPDNISVSIQGNRTNGLFKQVTIATNNPSSDSTQTEMPASAWTCNATGSPTCDTRALVKYDVSSLPANAIINSAKLYLYAKTNNSNGQTGNPTFGSANTSLLQRITTAWQQAGMNWTLQPSATTINQKVLPQSTNTSQNYIVDLTDFVRFWVNKPDSNFGMLFRLQDEIYYNSMVFNSGQAVDSLRPRLEICYHAPTGTLLPIKLISFDGVVNNNANHLTWKMENAENVRSIELERSANATAFSKIYNVATITSTNFQFLDEDLQGEQMRYYYRLKFINKDGSLFYSKTLVLTSLTNATGNLEIFPNPASNYTQLSFTSNKEGSTIIKIASITGNTVYSQNVALKKGKNNIILSDLTKTLSTGTYIIYIAINDKQEARKLFISK